jgi:hypothetical protein
VVAHAGNELGFLRPVGHVVAHPGNELGFLRPVGHVVARVVIERLVHRPVRAG